MNWILSKMLIIGNVNLLFLGISSLFVLFMLFERHICHEIMSEDLDLLHINLFDIVLFWLEDVSIILHAIVIRT